MLGLRANNTSEENSGHRGHSASRNKPNNALSAESRDGSIVVGISERACGARGGSRGCTASGCTGRSRRRA